MHSSTTTSSHAAIVFMFSIHGTDVRSSIIYCDLHHILCSIYFKLVFQAVMIDGQTSVLTRLIILGLNTSNVNQLFLLEPMNADIN